MDIKTKIQLDALMEEFMWLQTGEDSAVFDAKWRVFYESLNREDAKIAWTAWLNTISENLSEIKKLVRVMPDKELREFSTSFLELRHHPFMQKRVAQA